MRNEGKSYAVTRLIITAVMFIFFMYLAVRDMSRGSISAIGDIIAALAFPAPVWLCAKAVCLVFPLVKELWDRILPLSISALVIKTLACAGICAVPAFLVAMYVIAPIMNFLIALNSDFGPLLLLILMTLFTGIFTWMDICRVRDRSFIESVRNLFSKKTHDIRENS